MCRWFNGRYVFLLLGLLFLLLLVTVSFTNRDGCFSFRVDGFLTVKSVNYQANDQQLTVQFALQLDNPRQYIYANLYSHDWPLARWLAKLWLALIPEKTFKRRYAAFLPQGMTLQCALSQPDANQFVATQKLRRDQRRRVVLSQLGMADCLPYPRIQDLICPNMNPNDLRNYPWRLS